MKVKFSATSLQTSTWDCVYTEGIAVVTQDNGGVSNPEVVSLGNRNMFVLFPFSYYKRNSGERER